MPKGTKKKKGLKKSTLTYLIIFFVVLLIGGVVWAATTGVLNFSAEISRGLSVDLDFDLTETASTNGCVANTGSTTMNVGTDCAVNISNNNDDLSFSFELPTSGTSQQIEFCVENVGTAPVEMGAITQTSVNHTTTEGTAAGADGMTIVWPNTSGVVVGVGENTCVDGSSPAPFIITATWDTAAAGTSSTVTATATLNYAQHTGP